MCARCGHARRTHVNPIKKLSRALKGKQARATCGESTDHGWLCHCRSRFHAA